MKSKSFILFFTLFVLLAEVAFSQIELKLIYPGTISESNLLVNDSQPIFKWDKIPQAQAYSVYIAEKEENFYKLIFNSSKHNAITDTTFIPPNNLLKPNTFYRWNVKAILFSGKSIFSKTFYFKTSDKLTSDVKQNIVVDTKPSFDNLQTENDELINKPFFSVSWDKDKRKSTNFYLAKKIGSKYKLIWKSDKIPSNKFSVEVPPKFLTDKSQFKWNMKIVDSKRRTTYTKPKFFYTNFMAKSKTPETITPAKLISPGTIAESGATINPENIVLKFITDSDSTKSIIQIYELNGSNEKLFFTSDTLYGKTIDYSLKKNFLLHDKYYFWQVKSFSDKQNYLLSEKLFFKTEKKVDLQLPAKPKHFEKEEIFLEMKYAGVVSKTINAIFENSIVYLPVSEILFSLEVDSKFDFQKKVLYAKNIFINKSLQVDILNNKINFADSVWSLSDYKIQQTDFDVYLPQEFFSKVLNIEARVDLNNLTLQINSEEPLPILSRKQREGKYGLVHSTQQTTPTKIDFNREQKYFNFGFLDYQLSHTINKYTSPNGYYSFSGGGEIFGGDFQLNTSGNFRNSTFAENRSTARWQYVFKKNKYISAFAAGTLDFDGLQYTTFDGISITNSPIEPRTNFGRIKVLDHAEPNFTVELYLNNQLIDVTKTDALGNFSFNLPLNYGTTLAKLKFYGPFGEYYEKTKVYQTPLLMLQESEFNYNINVGKQNLSRYNLKNFTAAYGITDWITTKIGFEHLEIPNQKAVIYNSTSLRLFDNYFTNFSFSPEKFYSINLDALFASQVAFDFGFEKYQRQEFYNPANINDKISAHLFYPLFIGGFQLNAQSFYSFTTSKNNEINDFSIGMSSNFSYFSPSINYHMMHVNSNDITTNNDNIDLGFNWSMNFLQRYFSFIRGSILTSRVYYNLTKSKTENLSVSLSSNLTENGRVQISYTNNFINKFSFTQLNIVFYFPQTQFSTSISKESFSNSLIGSIGYNIPNKNITLYNRNQVGRSGVVIRLFIDENNNGLFDNNEETIKNAKIDIPVADVKYMDNGLIIAHDLNPYTVYDFQIREESLKNPLLISKQKTYSFVTEPNSFKPINIPLHIAGEISGKVFRLMNKVKIPLAGLKIHIKNLDTNESISLNTFSDGSYYYFGLFPSRYLIFADEEQLKSIGLKQVEKEIKFEIQSKSSGDAIENLDILLTN